MANRKRNEHGRFLKEDRPIRKHVMKLTEEEKKMIEIKRNLGEWDRPNIENPNWLVIFSTYWGICLGPKDILNPSRKDIGDCKAESLAQYHDRVLGFTYMP